jgi:hypothetical protein
MTDINKVLIHCTANWHVVIENATIKEQALRGKSALLASAIRYLLFIDTEIIQRQLSKQSHRPKKLHTRYGR